MGFGYVQITIFCLCDDSTDLTEDSDRPATACIPDKQQKIVSISWKQM